MKKEIITIAGKPGSGKSTTGKKLAEILQYERASTGDYMRALATERNMTLDELTHLSETDTSIDQILDQYNIENREKNKLVIDSRLGFYFIPDSFKVYLDIDHKIAAQRIFNNLHENEHRKNEFKHDFNEIKNIEKSINERLQSERMRYQNLYQINDHTDRKNFDIVITTSDEKYSNNINQVVSDILTAYKKWLAE